MLGPWGEGWLEAGSGGQARFARLRERDGNTGLDLSLTRRYDSGIGRWMTPDREGGHLEDPQTLNKYVYARDNPTSLNDPSGRDFYLTCKHTDDNSDTCQQVQNGSNKIWVQGTADANNKFNPTVISGGLSGLFDQNGNYYSGTFDQSGVHFEDESGTISGNGVFKEGSPETDLLGSGLYAGALGKFKYACLGSCQAQGSLSDFEPGAVKHVEDRMRGLEHFHK